MPLAWRASMVKSVDPRNDPEGMTRTGQQALLNDERWLEGRKEDGGSVARSPEILCFRP
jgi:hypothetical protein